MNLQLVRHLWGVDLDDNLNSHVSAWKEVGYDALEFSLRAFSERDVILQLLSKNGFQWIPQIFSNDFVPGGSVADHLASFRKQIEECMNHSPLFFNAHSGSDSWSEAQAEEFFGSMLEMEREFGVAISHETHRMRYFGNPWATRDLLRKFPDLKLTCDFSHWVCVAERLLPDCGEIISMAAAQCHHLHARVGYEHGPQVSDPRAPEWAGHLAAHETWWDMVWKSQQQRGMEVSTLTPEFGPAPYLQTLPFTLEPVADLVEVCDWMAIRQAERYQGRKTQLRL